MIAATCIISVSAFGQVKFGVKAGFNSSRTSGLVFYERFNDRLLPSGATLKFSQGFHIGAYANYSFSSALGAQAEVMFSTQGGIKVFGFEGSGTFDRRLQHLSFINIPLLLDFKPFERPFSLLVGPQFGFCVNRESLNKELYGNDVNYTNFDAAIVLGAQYTFFNHLAVGLRYNVGLIPSEQFDYEYFYKPANEENFQKVASLRRTNNMLQLSVGWTF